MNDSKDQDPQIHIHLSAVLVRLAADSGPSGCPAPSEPSDKNEKSTDAPPLVPNPDSTSFSAQDYRRLTETGVNPVAIREYFDLKSADEIAHLAAVVSKKTDMSNAYVAVQHASQLRSQAEKFLKQARENMVNAMNLPTLYELAERLGVLDAILIYPGTTKNPLRHDPVAGPLLHRIREMESSKPSHENIEDVFILKNYRQILDSAGERSGQDRPSLPCSLDEALRYVSPVPYHFPHDALQCVFMDFLRVFPVRTPDQQRSHSEFKKLFSPMLLDLTAEQLAAMSGNSQTKAQLERNYKEIKAAVDSIEKSRHFREQFSPASSVPDIVKSEATRNFTTYWNKPKPVDTEDRLAWLAENFSPFWEEHATQYMDERARVTSAQKEGRRKMKEGTQDRDRPKWIRHTQAFADYLGTHTNSKPPQSAKLLVERVNDYKTVLLHTKPPGLADGRTIEKVISFLGALCQHAVSNKIAPSVGVEILRGLKEINANLAKEAQDEEITVEVSQGQREKPTKKYTRSYKALSEQTAIECLNILRMTLGFKALAIPSSESPVKVSAFKSKPVKESPGEVKKKQPIEKNTLRRSFRSGRKA
jgi:hypothetical protein